MDGQWTITIAPLAGLAFDVLTQIVIAHVSRGKVGASIIIGILGGLAVTLAVIALGSRRDARRDGWICRHLVAWRGNLPCACLRILGVSQSQYHLDADSDFA